MASEATAGVGGWEVSAVAAGADNEELIVTARLKGCPVFLDSVTAIARNHIEVIFRAEQGRGEL